MTNSGRNHQLQSIMQNLVFVATCLVVLLLLSPTSTGARRVDCTKFVFAPACRGVSAKRSGSEVPNFRDSSLHLNSLYSMDDIDNGVDGIPELPVYDKDSSSEEEEVRGVPGDSQEQGASLLSKRQYEQMKQFLTSPYGRSMYDHDEDDQLERKRIQTTKKRRLGAALRRLQRSRLSF